MEGMKEAATSSNRDSGLTSEDIQNIPVILALPVVNAPSGGPSARSSFHQTSSAFQHQPVESDEGQEQMWDEDHLLPLANIINTMRRVLPADAGVPSDVADILQQGTSDFILLITSQARKQCKQERHQKIKGDGIIWALKKLGFTNYICPLEVYLYHYWGHLKGTLHGNNMASPSMTAQSGPSQLQQELLSEASTSHGSQKYYE